VHPNTLILLPIAFSEWSTYKDHEIALCGFFSDLRSAAFQTVLNWQRLRISIDSKGYVVQKDIKLRYFLCQGEVALLARTLWCSVI
jgi:hypothetical protein